MRGRILALAGLTVAFAAVASAQDFKSFASKEGRYKALFPGEVRSDATDIGSGKEKLKFNYDMVELKGDTVFMVSFVDSSDEVAKQPVGPRLDKVRDGNKGEAGKVLEEKEITFGPEKYPGRDLLLQKPGSFIRNRAIFAGKRLYQVMVQSPSKEVVTSQSADKFIASFEITK
jgi:hypothetical protein